MDKVARFVGGLRVSVVVVLVSGGLACVAQPDPDSTVRVEGQLTGFSGVLTQHNDLARTGANLNEVILTTSNVAKGTFGKLKALPVDGQIYGQPLYVPALVNAQNVVQNVVFVATEKNKVYAFNADTFAPIWERDLESAWNPASSSCVNSIAPYGINSTPVIDPATSTMYVAVRTLTGGTPQHLLHALDLATGAEKQNGPLDMGLGLSGTGHLTVPGSGLGSTAGTGGTGGGSTLAFDPLIHQNRVALTLSANHVLSVGFGSYCDHDNFHGWLLRFDVSTPTVTRLTPYVTTPNTSRGSLWMGGAGFADDGTGAIYFMSGNGPLTTAPQVADTSGTSLGNAFVKLTGTTTPSVAPVVSSWFMPSDVTTLDNKDTDVGSSGPLLIPGTSLILGGGKGGLLYLLNKDVMGGFKAGTPLNPQIVQSFAASAGQWIVGSPVFWNRPGAGTMYIWPGKTPLEQYAFDAVGGKFNTTPINSTINPPDDAQGGNLAISANGSTTGTGILWATHALSTKAGQGIAVPGALYAFDANNVATELWDSNMVTGDVLASYAKYTVPTIANGKVYVSTFSNEVDVYGLLGTTRDAGVRDAGQDAPPPILTCATVDGGAAQPTTWSYVYSTYFAGTGSGDGGPVTLGHCAKCHDTNGSGHGFFASGADKDSFYAGLLAIHQINADAGASSNIGVPDASPLAWFGVRSTSGNIFQLMPQDYQPSQVPNPRAIAAVCGWVKAGAVNDVVCTSPLVSCNNQCFDLTSSNAHCGSCPVTCATGTSCLAGVCCATGSVNCSGTCAVTASDVNNCGACGTKCTAPANGSTSCAASVCKLACNTGFTLCGSTCVATASDVNNCGACGTKCTAPANGSTSCAASVCKLACNTGFTLCGSACVATASDVNNCGACGATCTAPANGSTSCAASVCKLACNTGFTLCGSTCVATASDVNNCGACGNKCTAPTNGTTSCAASVCKLACNTGFTLCGTACVATASDVNNCGACGTKCTAPANGSTSCAASVCKLACNTGFTLCGTTCVATASDVNNCGACGTKCTAPANGSTSCAASVCKLACNTGFTLCGSTCVATASDANNCGACGVTCATGTSCLSGVCCASGSVNCSGTCSVTATDVNNCGACGTKCTAPANGSTSCAASVCKLACNTGFTLCGSACVATASDVNDCGGCGVTCATGASCTAGVCSVACASGTTLCGTTCVTTASDVNNCGACGTKCTAPANGSTSCAASVCKLACNTGFTLCGSACVATASDVNNCGACGTKCTAPANGSTSCAASVCKLACNTGFTLCGSACVATASDVNNCGGCGVACATGASCTAGVCSVACASGTTLCGTTCVTTASDVNNCGACGTKCTAPANGSTSCAASVCKLACNTGFTLCGTTCVATASDVNNCGACGTKCTAPANGSTSCAASVCKLACNTGFTLCGSACVATASDVNNCGACGTKCTAPANGSTSCTASVCKLACNTGFTLCGTTCVATASDVNNCGACGATCTAPANGSTSCAASVCKLACNTGFTLCGSTCVATASDVNNCGACGTKCTAPTNGTTSCAASVCKLACNTGFTLCGTACFATASDVNNCGACGNKCTAPTNGTTSCAASVCKPACSTGTLCGSACVATTSDVNNCGACGNKCTAPTNGTTSCAASVCKPACSTGTLCGSACVATATDVNNCGGCGVTCAIGASCTAGVCSAAACTTTNALIDDFEDGNNQIAALEGRNGADYTYADTTGSTITPTAGSTFVPATPGNGTSTRAAHFNGMLSGATTVWAGMGMDFLAPKGLYNASKYTGISFFAKKGSTTANGAVRVKVPDRNTDPTGAICTSCSNDFGVDLTLTTTWTKYTIPFSTMAQQAGWGAPRPAKIDPTGVVAVQFQVGTTGQLYDIWVDDVTFTCN